MPAGFIRPLILFILISLFRSEYILSQDTDTLFLLENQLSVNYQKTLDTTYSGRSGQAEVFYDNFLSCLSIEESFEFPFEKLENIGKIYSPDKRIRIYTWNIPDGISENMYYGIIQYFSHDKEKINLVTLNRSDGLNFTNLDKTWSGSLYYKIIESKHAGRKYYALLGFDLNTPLSNKKVIEVISIDDFDTLYFCEKLLQYEEHMVDRIIFEYNEKAVMSLQYNENMKMIVFDHLSPSKPSLNGQYEFYGPDFTYDGLKWENGIWVYHSNIEITN